MTSTLAAPSPLATSAMTTATLSGLESGSPQDGILIHVIRTEDLIADKLASQPLLLERMSHLLIRVQLGNQSVAVNGHDLPILPGDRPLEVNVQLKQVQMVKMPKDSPLVPLGLTPPEVLNIADKYMSEGIVAAMLTVSQEPLSVLAMREDYSPVQAEAYKVTIAIKILEVDGLSLAQTEIPAIDLLHLVVHPDQADPTKVATVTTLAPESLSDPQPSAPAVTDANKGMFRNVLDATRASLESTLRALSSAMHGVAAHSNHMLSGGHHRKPCHKRPHHHHHHPNHSHHQASVASQPHHLAVEAPEKQPHHKQHSFRHKMGCFVRMVARSSLAVLILGLPLALVVVLFSALISFLLRRRRQAPDSSTPPPVYEAIPTSEDHLDEKSSIIVPVDAPADDKL
ncbi:uncharacterized protein VP01_749g7 [Puccinia sorghi]|uniref:Uncharacterized protein n=1 Tax=Puccinia sorghi TaxID=27349 RepID=A0A0L6UC97_9BASI|nr:uncharacterized protein VP01_749g7 [Puccinia sorghi]